jgi:hypothetical protein
VTSKVDRISEEDLRGITGGLFILKIFEHRDL